MSCELLGRVVAKFLSQYLEESDDQVGSARFLLHGFSPDQAVAVARAVLQDVLLYKDIDIKLPKGLVGNAIVSTENPDGLPQDIVTAHRTTHYRNISCNKKAFLLANIGDDEDQSLQEVVPIGSRQLFEEVNLKLWVDEAARDTNVSEEQRQWWVKALKGLRDAHPCSLQLFTDYLFGIRKALGEGKSLVHSLGDALPYLLVPRDANFAVSINEKHRNHAAKWKARYGDVLKNRQCFFYRQGKNQAPLSKEDLRLSFEKTRDAIPEEYHSLIESFIDSDGDIRREAVANLMQVEWETIKPFFDGVIVKVQETLGAATQKFFQDREPELQLSDDEKATLETLAKTKRKTPLDDDDVFYRNHRDELTQDPALKKKWDKFIHGTSVECEDFFVGFVQCLGRLFSDETTSLNRRLVISCDRTSKAKLKDLNCDAGLFFTCRYRGLEDLFGPYIEWNLGHLFNFPKFVQEWKSQQKPFTNASKNRASLRLKFTFELYSDENPNRPETVQLEWKFNPKSVACKFFKDMDYLKKQPLVRGSSARNPISTKGRFQSLDLSDVGTLTPTFGDELGRFIPSATSEIGRESNIEKEWVKNHQALLKDQRLTQELADKLKKQFDDFREEYAKAFEEFFSEGLVSERLVEQSKKYGTLLRELRLNAPGDRIRDDLLKPLLRLGVISIEGSKETLSLIAPWHPLRLAAIVHKARLIAQLTKRLLRDATVRFGDSVLFFRELSEEISQPFYPEVIVGWREASPCLLALTDSYLDYSLHEPPVIKGGGFDETNETPEETAKLIVNLTKRFLALYPHEKANYSILLYNCDSARLPYAVMEKLSSLRDEDEDIRCQIILRHRDGSKLQQLYEKIVEISESDCDAFTSSDATDDFMARLRIGIMANQAPVSDALEGPPCDIVFLHDVIARHADLSWYKEPSTKPIDAACFIPSRWSKRRPAPEDNLRSSIYLCCPVQTDEGWAFLDAVGDFLFERDEEQAHFLPARLLNFSDDDTRLIFEETHKLGYWVVNYDSLLDRRQLKNQHVQVIRFKQGTEDGRNTLISSKASIELLKKTVVSRINDLAPGIPENDKKTLAQSFIDDANGISGDLVLRAAKNGRNASELMGVVLSRYIIDSEFDKNTPLGWYFLDDYATWLGHAEERIADLLAVALETKDDGSKCLSLIVSEAKYVGIANLDAMRKSSQAQLRDTLHRIQRAVSHEDRRLDQELWLARLSDLLMDGIPFSAGSDLNLSLWRQAIREQSCDIRLRGYSHVFVSSETTLDGNNVSEATIVSGTNNGIQEVFSTSQLRDLIEAYRKKKSPLKLRQTLSGFDDVQTSHSYTVFESPISDCETAEPQQTATKAEISKEPHPVAVSTTIPPSVCEADTAAILNAGTPSSQFPHERRWAQVSEIISAEPQQTADSIAEQHWLEETARNCRSAFQHFNFQSTLLSKTLTPNAAILRFQGSSQLTVGPIQAKRTEFLTTHGLNIISIRPESGQIAVAIARPKRRTLELQEVWKNWNPVDDFGNRDLLIGLHEEDNEPLFLSPRTNAPHTLIAGSTGSGKSVLMQNILLAISCTNTPEEAKIVLIDPKSGVDYFSFDDLPHLRDGIIDEQDHAIAVLEELVEEMGRRYSILKANRVSNIFALNHKVPVEDRLPFLWVIHDEFAEWMMIPTYKDAVSDIVNRLGVKARAAGISLVFAAQRPDANVMPMQLRSNLGNRLVLRVDGEGTSEIALTEKGAERLLGKGHLAAKLEGESAIVYAQVPLVSHQLISSLVGIWNHEETK